jgi:hypothetical protein
MRGTGLAPRAMGACGLALVVALTWGATAGAQTVPSVYGEYPTPGPYNVAARPFVAAPAMPGSGGSYAYVQQGGGWGASPNAYYSGNFFTQTPMAPTARYATGAPYSYPRTYSSYYGSPSYSYGAAGYPTYSYSARRAGPLRRVFRGW